MPNDYRKGFWLTLGGVLAFTPDALLIRLTAVDPFTLAFGRGLLAGMVILIAYTLFISGGFVKALKPLGWWGLLFAGLQTCASLTFYASFSYTSVANVLVIFACTPLIAALFSRVLFGETVTRSTKVAIACVAGGLLVLASGDSKGTQWIGDALALANAIILGLSFAIVRGSSTIQHDSGRGRGASCRWCDRRILRGFPANADCAVGCASAWRCSTAPACDYPHHHRTEVSARA